MKPRAMHRLEDLLSGGLPGAGLGLLKRSRILSAAAWRALRVSQDLSGSAPNELRQLERMEPAPGPGPGLRVLIFSLRGWTAHLAWETTIARALHLRGAETLTVVCDGVLPASEPRVRSNDFRSTCDRCRAQSGAFLERTGLPHAWLGAYLEPGEVEEAHRTVAPLDLERLRAHEDAGIPVGRLVGASVNRHLLRGGEVTPEHIAAYRRFVAAGIVARRAAGRILARFRPERILMLNGLFFAEAILLELARREGIEVWTYERGKRVDSLILARDRPVLRVTFEDRWPARRAAPLREVQRRALDEYMASRFAGEVGIERLWPERSAPEGPEGPAAGTAEGPPTAVLYTNVLWDSAVYESDVAFPSMMDWVLHTIDWFRQRPERRLVVRIHPAEVRVPFKRSRDSVVERLARVETGLPVNVRIVQPESTVDSYALLRGARVVLAYTSTIGLEGAVEGVPVVVAGRTHYRNRGFTLDPKDPAEYDRDLERALAMGRLSEDARELARRYAWLYFFEEIVPFPLVREHPRSYVTFGYRENAELAPGRDPSLDAICASILTGVPLSNPLAP